MSIYLYEEAILKSLQSVVNAHKDKIVITPSDNIQQILPRITNEKDSLKLPFIHIARVNWGLLNNRSHSMKMNGHINNNFPLHYEEYCSPDGRIHRLEVIPIRENDEFIRELIWFFSTMNEFTIQVPYGLDINHVFSVRINNDITMEKDIKAQVDYGQLYIQSFTITCDDAYLWKSSSHNPICIDFDIVYDNDDNLNTTLVDIDYNQKTVEESDVTNG